MIVQLRSHEILTLLITSEQTGKFTGHLNYLVTILNPPIYEWFRILKNRCVWVTFTHFMSQRRSQFHLEDVRCRQCVKEIWADLLSKSGLMLFYPDTEFCQNSAPTTNFNPQVLGSIPTGATKFRKFSVEWSACQIGLQTTRAECLQQLIREFPLGVSIVGA